MLSTEERFRTLITIMSAVGIGRRLGWRALWHDTRTGSQPAQVNGLNETVQAYVFSLDMVVR